MSKETIDTTIYLRIGKTKKGCKVDASDKPNHASLTVGDKAIPTLSFGLVVKLPADLMKGAALIAGIININDKEAKIEAIPKPKFK